MEIRITLKELGKALRGEKARAIRAGQLASRASSLRLKAHIAGELDRRGITDRGILKNAGKVVRISSGAATVGGDWYGYRNDAFHAGIVDGGARPHSVSPEGRIAIAEWFVRKVGLSEKEAESATWAYCKKLEKTGQAPTWVFRDQLIPARTFFNEEFVRIMNASRAG